MSEAWSPLPPACAQAYDHVRTLAAGGFGSVHLAVQRGLGRQVVIKLLHSELLADPVQIARFQNEARMTAAISSPNVVKLIAAGFDGVPWIAYEYLAAGSVRQLLASGALPPALAVTIVSQVLAGLAAGHACGILHRDVKPENVLTDGSGLFKIADFGIAKWTRAGAVETKAGLVLGSPAYLAPEAIEGAHVDARSDVYAAGVVLYELLSGRPPFEGDSPVAVLTLQLRAAPPPLSANLARDESELLRIVARALEKDPRARFQSAREMQDALAGLRSAPATRTPARRSTLVSPAPLDGPRGAGTRIRSGFGAVALALSAAWASHRGWPVSIPDTETAPSPLSAPASRPVITSVRALAAPALTLARGSTDSASLAARIAGELPASVPEPVGRPGAIESALDDVRVALEDRMSLWRDLGRLQEASALLRLRGVPAPSWLDELMRSPFVYRAASQAPGRELTWTPPAPVSYTNRPEMDPFLGVHRWAKRGVWTPEVDRGWTMSRATLRVGTYKLRWPATVRIELDGVALPSVVRDRSEPSGGEEWEVRLPRGLPRPGRSTIVFSAAPLLDVLGGVDVKVKSARLVFLSEDPPGPLAP